MRPIESKNPSPTFTPRELNLPSIPRRCFEPSVVHFLSLLTCFSPLFWVWLSESHRAQRGWIRGHYNSIAGGFLLSSQVHQKIKEKCGGNKVEQRGNESVWEKGKNIWSILIFPVWIMWTKNNILFKKKSIKVERGTIYFYKTSLNI